VVKDYVSGIELVRRPKHRAVIDFFGLKQDQARRANPRAYQRVLETVKPLRAVAGFVWTGISDG
jgi:hypothetical protein